jgi:hypothetical protein
LNALSGFHQFHAELHRAAAPINILGIGGLRVLLDGDAGKASA